MTLSNFDFSSFISKVTKEEASSMKTLCAQSGIESGINNYTTDPSDPRSELGLSTVET